MAMGQNPFPSVNIPLPMSVVHLPHNGIPLALTHSQMGSRMLHGCPLVQAETGTRLLGIVIWGPKDKPQKKAFPQKDLAFRMAILRLLARFSLQVPGT